MPAELRNSRCGNLHGERGSPGTQPKRETHDPPSTPNSTACRRPRAWCARNFRGSTAQKFPRRPTIFKRAMARRRRPAQELPLSLPLSTQPTLRTAPTLDVHLRDVLRLCPHPAHPLPAVTRTSCRHSIRSVKRPVNKSNRSSVTPASPTMKRQRKSCPHLVLKLRKRDLSPVRTCHSPAGLVSRQFQPVHDATMRGGLCLMRA